MTEAPRAPAVSKAVAVLGRLAESSSREPVRLADLAEATGTAKSSLLSICNALVDGGLVQRHPNGYSLGPGLVALSSAYLSGMTEVEAFYAACRSLIPGFPDTIHLATFSSDMEISYLARVEGQTMPVLSPIGRSLPANCSATGKALLAQLPDVEVERRLHAAVPMPVLTAQSLHEPQELLDDIVKVRAQGYGLDDEETTPGLFCVGMPVPTHHGPAWAVGITMIKTADVDRRLTEAVHTLEAVTVEMARQLGR